VLGCVAVLVDPSAPYGVQTVRTARHGIGNSVAVTGGALDEDAHVALVIEAQKVVGVVGRRVLGMRGTVTGRALQATVPL
jgi:hypothetical protein